jgi:hypothetical protein
MFNKLVVSSNTLNPKKIRGRVWRTRLDNDAPQNGQNVAVAPKRSIHRYFGRALGDMSEDALKDRNACE